MNPFLIALKTFLFMTLLTGIAYPFLITAIAQWSAPELANGSLMKKNGRIKGSILIAQKNEDDRYFWPRPSAIDYDPLKPSGGSNWGPSNLKLKQAIDERRKKLGQIAPSELLYASGSGLDPHISLEAAYFQLSRISKARSIGEGELKQLIQKNIEGRQLGFLGPSYLNVMLLNEALDEMNEQPTK